MQVHTFHGVVRTATSGTWSGSRDGFGRSWPDSQRKLRGASSGGPRFLRIRSIYRPSTATLASWRQRAESPRAGLRETQSKTAQRAPIEVTWANVHDCDLGWLRSVVGVLLREMLQHFPGRPLFLCAVGTASANVPLTTKPVNRFADRKLAISCGLPHVDEQPLSTRCSVHAFT